MNTQPEAARAQKAADLFLPEQVSTVYYVINDYWWDAPRLVETAKMVASSWHRREEGRLTIFRFDLARDDALAFLVSAFPGYPYTSR
jgi:hypothetical protein